MENGRKLEDLMILNDRFNLATQAIISDESELSVEVEQIAQTIADEVVVGELAIKALRQQVAQANNFDREAVEIANGSINNLSNEDFSEALARRIAHHSGRQALYMVKTQKRRQAYLIRSHHKKRFGDYASNG